MKKPFQKTLLSETLSEINYFSRVAGDVITSEQNVQYVAKKTIKKIKAANRKNSTKCKKKAYFKQK